MNFELIILDVTYDNSIWQAADNVPEHNYLQNERDPSADGYIIKRAVILIKVWLVCFTLVLF